MFVSAGALAASPPGRSVQGLFGEAARGEFSDARGEFSGAAQPSSERAGDRRGVSCNGELCGGAAFEELASCCAWPPVWFVMSCNICANISGFDAAAA